jgi:hypothetical protein
MNSFPEIKPKKRVFIGLLGLTCFCLAVILFVLWYIPIVGLQNIHPSLPLIAAVVVSVLILSMILGGLLLVLTLIRGRDILFSRKLRGIVVKGLFPFIILVGRFIGVSRERIQQSFIEVNNHLVRSDGRRVPPDKLLILLPHCVQEFDCQIRITGNILNCRKCGNCEIKDLAELSERFHVKIAVATGGTLARRIIVENRPKAIVAVACELDLTTGIQDTYPIPVIGILNERPDGPCMNTRVDIGRVRQAILDFLKVDAKDRSVHGTERRAPGKSENGSPLPGCGR